MWQEIIRDIILVILLFFAGTGVGYSVAKIFVDDEEEEK